MNNGFNGASTDPYGIGANSMLGFPNAWIAPDILPVAGASTWLKARSLTGLIDGNSVGTMTDFSGNNNDATQSVAGQKPIYRTGIINGKPVVRFDGSDDIITIPDAGIRADFSFFIVCKFNNFTPAYAGVLATPCAGNTDGGGFLAKSNGKSAHYIGRGSSTYSSYDGTGSITYTPAVFQVISSVNDDGGTMASYRNGTLDASTSQSSTALSGRIDIAAHPQFAARYCAIDIAELVVFPFALSSTNRALMESYLAAQYGL